MSWMSLFSRRPTRTVPGQRKAAPKSRLAFDQLEDRLVPSTTLAVSVVNPPPTFNEGVAINLASTVDAVGAATYAWSVTKDGAPFASGTAATFSFTPDDNGVYAVTLSVTDTVNTLTDTSLSITVQNVPPVAGVTGPSSGNMGQTVNFNLTATDVPLDAAAGFSYNIDWNGDGVVDQTVAATANNGTGLSVSHAFNVPGPNTVTVTATDKDGGTSAPATLSVMVTNGAAVVNGNLIVAGGFGNDSIVINPRGKPSATNATLQVHLNGKKPQVFSGVNAITVYALDGSDNVQIAGAIKVAATVFAGAGNDRVKGGAGNDVLVGEAGDDDLNGGTGNDIVIGGAGADRLLGGPGDDLLIAGATSFDADLASLTALQLAWTGAGSYQQKVQALSSATATVHLTDGAGGSVTDDGAVDTLTGASGTDWFFASATDKITDQHVGEFLNAIVGGGHGKGPGGKPGKK